MHEKRIGPCRRSLPFSECPLSASAIFIVYSLFKVPNTPSFENYDNSFGNLISNLAEQTVNMRHVIAHEMHFGQIGKKYFPKIIKNWLRGWWWCKPIIMSNPTLVTWFWGCVKVELWF